MGLQVFLSACHGPRRLEVSAGRCTSAVALDHLGAAPVSSSRRGIGGGPRGADRVAYKYFGEAPWKVTENQFVGDHIWGTNQSQEALPRAADSPVTVSPGASWVSPEPSLAEFPLPCLGEPGPPAGYYCCGRGPSGVRTRLHRSRRSVHPAAAYRGGWVGCCSRAGGERPD